MKRLFSALLIIAGFSAFAAPGADDGTIRGQVHDAGDGTPMYGVQVVIKGTTTGDATDFTGQYSIEGVEPGTYTLVFQYLGYETVEVENVIVTADKIAVQNTSLGEGSIMLDVGAEVVAVRNQNTEAAVLTLQKKSANLLDGISSETFSITGAGDAGSAVKSVPGVSVEGGKYVYVRGLGDRYSKTLLNGANIPSLDPDRNTVQMDLFPTNIIDNIIVYKTFTPDLPGDFTGGLVDIVTKDFPEILTIRVSASLGYNPQVHMKEDFITYEGGKTDWLAMSDETRDIPVSLENVPDKTQALINNAAADQLSDATSQFNDIMAPTNEAQFMDQSYSVTIGNQKKLFGKPFGFIASLSYKSESEATENDSKKGEYKLTGSVATTDELNPEYELTGKKTSESVQIGALLTGSLKLSDASKIGLRLMHNRSGEKNTEYFQGPFPKDDPNLYNERRSLEYEVRTITAGQLFYETVWGEKGDNKLEFSGTVALSTMQQPDLRYFINDINFDGAGNATYDIQSALYTDPTRFYRNMDQLNTHVKADYSLNFNQWGGEKSKFKVGLSHIYQDRDFTDNQIEYTNLQDDLDYNGNPSDLFNDVYVRESNETGIIVQDASEDRNDYTANTQIAGGYGMVELPFTGNLKSILGVRTEYTNVNFSNTELTDANLMNQIDILPSAAFTYEVKEDMNIRASYARTVARPTFREIADIATYDFIRDLILVGNPELEITGIHNADLRWENFMDKGEIVSFSLFYKGFSNPIEKVINPQAANTEISFQNVENATVMGAEVEIRKNFGFINEKLENLMIGANFTYAKSAVDIDSAELSEIRASDPDAPATRKMFGQSPYIINAYIAFKSDKGTKANLSFNMQGARLALVTPGTTPDVYEQPVPSLNFNISQEIKKKWTVKLAVNNILNPNYSWYQSYKGTDYTYTEYKKGTEVSVGVTYNFKNYAQEIE